MLSKRTLEKIDQIRTYRFFSKTGGVRDLGETVIAVSGWPDAVLKEKTRAWQAVRLQASNLLARKVNRRDWDRFSVWNDLVAEVKKGLKELPLSGVGTFVESHQLPKAIFDSVQWDLLMICMETEFCDLVPPVFSLPFLDPWYQRGHFPCGWTGPAVDTDWEGVLPEFKLYVI